MEDKQLKMLRRKAKLSLVVAKPFLKIGNYFWRIHIDVLGQIDKLNGRR
jgi:hypothetical protein